MPEKSINLFSVTKSHMQNTLLEIMQIEANRALERSAIRNIFDKTPRSVDGRKCGRLEPYEQKAIRFFSSTISKEEIAAKFGVSVSTVRRYS